MQGDGFYLSPNEAAFEDGTVNYLNIPAIKTGLQHLEKVGIDTIGERVHCLTGWLLKNLLALKHSNRKPMVRIYGPTDTEMRGGAVTMNLYGEIGLMFSDKALSKSFNDLSHLVLRMVHNASL